MVRHRSHLLFRRLIPLVAAASLLACALLVGLICPQGAAGETATVGWIHQFGTSGNDSARGVSAVAGSIYVGEFRGDPYPHQSYVHKYDAVGSEVWSTEVYDSRENGLYGEGLDAMYACSSGIYVAMTGLYGGPDGDGGAAGLLKYSASGTQEWVSGIGIDSVNDPHVVFADSSGIYVAGSAFGVPSEERGFVRKYDSSGTIIWTKEYNTDPDYFPSGVSAYSGNVYVGGVVSGTGESFVRKHDSAGTELWTRLPGFAPPVAVNAVSADSSGVYVAGAAHDPSEADGRQAFVRKYDLNGNNVWTREFGSSEDDVANAIFVNSSGIHVAGYTQGQLPGQTTKGGTDAFVRKYDASGNEVWTYQFGSSADDSVTSISADATGIYAAGDADGAMPGLTSSGGQDVFVVQIATNDPPAQPTNVSPADAATGVSLTPTLQSSAFSDPDAGDTHKASQWQITATAGDYSSYVFNSGTDTSNLTTISVLSGGLANSTTYYWHVRHQDNHGAWSSWSTESRFTTLALAASPSVSTLAPTGISATAATLNGNLASLGTADNVWVCFEWGLTDSYGNTTTLQGPMWAPDTWSYPLSGLTPGTTYHFRAKAQGVGTGHGSDMTFTLATAVLSVTTNAATSIGTSSVTLNGDLTSLGTADNAWVCFEWGLTDSYGSTTILQGPMWAPGTWSYPLSGLTPGTTYHFRATAHSGGTAYGSDMTFSTGNSPEVEGVDPDSGKRNQDLTVTIAGANLYGATVVSFGSGITVEDFTVNSSTEITAEIAIDAHATKGPRDVSVTTEWGTATKTDAFSVVGGGGGICGTGVPGMPDQGSEMTTTLAALGVLLGIGYLLVRKGGKSRRSSVWA